MQPPTMQTRDQHPSTVYRNHPTWTTRSTETNKLTNMLSEIKYLKKRGGGDKKDTNVYPPI